MFFFIWGVISSICFCYLVGAKFRVVDKGDGRFKAQVRHLFFWHIIADYQCFQSNAEQAIKDHIERKQYYRENKGKVVKYMELRPPPKKEELVLQDINFDPLTEIKQKYETIQ